MTSESMQVFNLPYILKDNFTGYRILDWQIIFPLNSLNISFTSFLLLLLLMGISCFSLGSLFVVVIYHLTTKCLGIVLFVFILLGVLLVSWTCQLMFSIKFENIIVILLSNCFLSIGFYFHFGIPIANILEYLTTTLVFEVLSLILFLSFPLILFLIIL